MPPVVPRKERTVTTAPLPDAGLDVDVPDIGTSRAAGEAASLVADIHEKELRSANNTAVMNEIAGLSAFENDLLYNPETGLMTRENESAFEVNTEANEAWTKYRADALARLSNETQREAFTPHLDSKWASTDRLTKKHAIGQKNNFQAEQVNNIAVGEAAAAANNYDNPERIGLAIGTYVQSWVELAADQDIDPDSAQYEEGLRVPISNIHKSVINAMLVDKKFTDARDYHSENKDAIFDDDAIVKSLKAGELVEASTVKSVEIVSKSETLSEALEELKKIKKDPDNLPGFKDAVRKRVKTFYKDQAEAEKALSSEAAEEAHTIMERAENEGRTTSEVLEASYPRLWGTMNRKDKKAIESRFNKPIPETNDRDAYLTFVGLATSNPEKVAEMTASDILIATESFDKTHKARADALWRAAKEKVRADEETGEKPAKTTNVLSAKDSATQVWKGAGLPDTTGRKATEESKEAFAKFLSNVDLVVGEESIKLGRVLTAREEREAIDKVMSETVVPEMSDPNFVFRFFGSEPKPTGVVDVQGVEVSTFAGEIEEGEKILIQNPRGTGTLLATMGADGVLRAPDPDTGESVPVDTLQTTTGKVKVGDVLQGFEFTGGDPNDKKNWKKVE